MNQLGNILYSLVDSRKDNRTMIGLLLCIVAFWAKARGYIEAVDLPYALTFIATLTGVNIAAIAHEDNGQKAVEAAKITAAAPPATNVISQQEKGSGNLTIETVKAAPPADPPKS